MLCQFWGASCDVDYINPVMHNNKCCITNIETRETERQRDRDRETILLLLLLLLLLVLVLSLLLL